jgi:dipeptidyl aminopeptidase/acylaminoacyl peptidase
VAVAADYRRLAEDEYRRTLFPFRSEEDLTAALAVVRGAPNVDPDRVALAGFSQGGVFSLLMAARDPRVKAVVAYYPITDFTAWLNDPPGGLGRRLVFWFIRRHFRQQSGARTDEEFAAILERASPLRQADGITAPVLLVHGLDDRTAPVDESRRLARKLESLGREVTLLELEGAGHVFNFYDREAPQGRQAWDAVIDFFHRTLG